MNTQEFKALQTLATVPDAQSAFSYIGRKTLQQESVPLLQLAEQLKRSPSSIEDAVSSLLGVDIVMEHRSGPSSFPYYTLSGFGSGIYGRQQREMQESVRRFLR